MTTEPTPSLPETQTPSRIFASCSLMTGVLGILLMVFMILYTPSKPTPQELVPMLIAILLPFIGAVFALFGIGLACIHLLLYSTHRRLAFLGLVLSLLVVMIAAVWGILVRGAILPQLQEHLQQASEQTYQH